MEIIHIALRSGYTFKKVFAHVNKIVELSQNKYVGIADQENSFAHYELEKLCRQSEEKGVMPIFGVRLKVVPDASERIPPRGQFGKELIFIAKTNEGLEEIYNLIKINFDNFYYRGNISWFDVRPLSKNVIVIAEDFTDSSRIDYIALTPNTPKFILKKYPKIPRVAMVDNYYIKSSDEEVYQIFTFSKTPGQNKTETKTYPQYVMSTIEWRRFFRNSKEDLNKAIKNTHKIAKQCKAKLQKAPMIKYNGKESIEYMCKLGAKKRKINIESKGEYKDRYDREIKLIKEKEYTDYFLIVADLIRWSKQRMFVGPSRGSSAGSLVCYLLGITEVDPIPYDLIFERFIDETRKDLPDIDIDFPDNKRDMVIKYLIKKYGEDKVKHIAIVSKMKARVAISEWCKGLMIPEYETEALKNAVIERSRGDARAAMCLLDTFETTDIGKEFLENFPNMHSVSQIEDHPRHHGVHAAGIIICNNPIHKYCGVSGRDNVSMVDKYAAEYLNLLKIDVLGLRTLSVLADAAKQVGMDHNDFYKLDLEDKKVFKIFNKMRIQGIFQFEGYSLSQLTRKMGIKRFDDIVAITSLARPGALYSGGANRYVKYRLGQDRPVFCRFVWIDW